MKYLLHISLNDSKVATVNLPPRTTFGKLQKWEDNLNKTFKEIGLKVTLDAEVVKNVRPQT